MRVSLDQAEAYFKGIAGGDNKVCKKELTDALKAAGKSQSEIDECFDVFDVDDDGMLTRAEFLYAICGKKDRDECLAQTFDEMDADGSGSLSLDEIKSKCDLVKNVKGAAETFTQYDADGSKTLSRQEFVDMMNSCKK